MFAVAFGANLFSALMPSYREVYAFSQSHVTFLLAVYIVGLIPSLLLSGPFSDRYGRRTIIRPSLLISAIGSLVLLAGVWLGFAALLVGRFIVGVSMGMVLAAGASWLKEISTGPAAISARRATVAISAGFGIGPVISGAMAEFLPAPDILPYLAHVLIVAVVAPFLWTVPQASPVAADPSHTPSLASRLFSPTVLTPRFLWAVAAWAPWVFGAATTSFTVLPVLADVGWMSAYTGLVAALTLGTGVMIQPWAQRLGEGGKVQPAIVGLTFIVLGMLASIVVALTHNPLTVIPAAILLGASYGVMMVSGLREVQQMAPPAELGAATGIYYALTYAGFFAPFALSFTGPAWGYPLSFAIGAVIALASIVPVVRVTSSASERRH